MFLAAISSGISSCFLSFQFPRSGTDNVTVHAHVCGLFCVLFMILRILVPRAFDPSGFIQAKGLNLVVGLHVRAVSVFGKRIYCGLRFFGVFLCGFAVFGAPLRPLYIVQLLMINGGLTLILTFPKAWFLLRIRRSNFCCFLHRAF